MTINIYLLLSLFLLNISCSRDQRSSEIEDIMTRSYENGLFQGSVLVAQNGRVVYKGAFGYCDTSKNELITTDTRIYLASLSKAFTAMAVMILNERNELSYDDKVIDYIPEFSPFGNDITIRHLLTHTSGIPDYWDLNISRPGLTNQDVMKSILEYGKLDFTPGDKYSYSNSGYIVLASLIEQISKKSYSEFISTNIFSPLKMNASFVCTSLPPTTHNRAIGINDKGQISDYNILTTGDGGIFSTVTDVYLWDQALYDNILIPHESLMEAYTPMKLNDGSKSNYGFGWEIIPEINAVAHGGSFGGFGTGIFRDLTNKTLLVLLSNKGESLGVQKIAQPILEVLSKE